MSLQAVEQLTFDFLPHLPAIVQKHEGRLSSDAGLLPMRQFDQRWNYTRRFAQCLLDPHPQAPGGPRPSRQHSLLSMLRQRLFGILAGYEDCNDHDTLRGYRSSERFCQGQNWSCWDGLFMVIVDELTRQNRDLFSQLWRLAYLRRRFKNDPATASKPMLAGSGTTKPTTVQYVIGEKLTNQSLRERFKLAEDKTATVSQIITATLDAGKIN